VRTVDAGVSGDDAVAEKLPLAQAKRRRAVHGEAVQFDERAVVDERLDAFPGGTFPALVLARVGRFPRRRQRLGPHPFEAGSLFVGGLSGGHRPGLRPPSISLRRSR